MQPPALDLRKDSRARVRPWSRYRHCRSRRRNQSPPDRASQARRTPAAPGLPARRPHPVAPPPESGKAVRRFACASNIFRRAVFGNFLAIHEELAGRQDVRHPDRDRPIERRQLHLLPVPDIADRQGNRRRAAPGGVVQIRRGPARVVTPSAPSRAGRSGRSGRRGWAPPPGRPKGWRPRASVARSRGPGAR